MEFPGDLKYHEEHSWAKLDGDTAIVGISDFAQDQLGEIVLIEMTANAGDRVESGKPYGEVQSTKAVNDLYSPVSGELLEINEEAIEAPEIVNEDCYGKGWLIKVKLDDASELDSLMDSGSYADSVEE